MVKGRLNVTWSSPHSVWPACVRPAASSEQEDGRWGRQTSIMLTNRLSQPRPAGLVPGSFEIQHCWRSTTVVLKRERKGRKSGGMKEALTERERGREREQCRMGDIRVCVCHTSLTWKYAAAAKGLKEQTKETRSWGYSSNTSDQTESFNFKKTFMKKCGRSFTKPGLGH